MAKLTANLSSPSAPSGSRAAPAARGSEPELASVISQGMSLFAQHQKSKAVSVQNAKLQADKLAAGQAIGDAQTSILDLEDQRNSMALLDQQMAARVQDIHRDGVTPEEQITLDGLQKEVDKLSASKRGGILNPFNMQTRMNALHKNALGDVANQALQPQINALFQQGRGIVKTPTSTAQQKENAAMDEKYGVNNWSGADLGREKGKAIYLEQTQKDAMNNFHTFRGQEAMTFMNIADDHVRKLRRSLNESGSINDVDIDTYRAGINNNTQILLSNVNKAVSESRKNGVPIDADAVKQSKADIMEQSKFYMNMLKEGNEFEGKTMQLQRLNNMNSIVDAINKTRNSGLAGVAGLIAGTGGGGDLTALAQIVNAPDGLLAAVSKNMSPSLRIDANTMRTNAANIIAMSLDGVDYKEAAEHGLVNKRLAATVAAIGLRTTDNPIAKDSYHSAMETVDYSSTESALDVYLRSDTKNNVLASKDGNRRLPSVALHFIDNIKAEITPLEMELLEIDENGNLQIRVPTDAGQRAKVGRFSLYTNKLLMKFGQFADSYNLNKKELFAELLPKPKAEESE